MTSFPTSIELDITDLTIGAQLRVSDLALPAGVTTDLDPESAVVIGQPPRVVALEEEVEGEAEAGEEGAAAEGAESADAGAQPAAEE